MNTNKTEVPKKYPYVDEENNWLYLNNDLIVVNEVVKMRWSKCTKKYYIDRGYIFTKIGDMFDVNIVDLSKGSHTKVNAICPREVCGKIRKRAIKDLLRRNTSRCQGCSQFVDLTGLTYGEWFVIRNVEPNKYGASMWWCKCVCGIEKQVSGSSLLNGASTTCSYKHGLTDQERDLGRHYSEVREWSIQIKEKDNYICQCCEKSPSGELESHHLNNYSDYPDQRFELDNGITLCNTCHKNFHIGFMGSYRNSCTEQDFRNFCLEFYPEAQFLKQYQTPT